MYQIIYNIYKIYIDIYVKLYTYYIYNLLTIYCGMYSIWVCTCM